MTKEEAIEIVKKHGILADGTKFESALRELIPELAESEDERIRKEIIEFVDTTTLSTDERHHRWIAWLEKQKEQKPAEWSEEESLDEFTRNIRNLITTKLTTHTKGLDGSEISSTVFIDDETAKDIANGVLFYVGKEAIKNPDREIPEWSEEDENTLKYLHELISFGYTDKFFDAQTAADMREWLNAWLKSLKPSWKPSEEQMKALQNAVALTACDKELVRLYNQLKKL